LDGATGVKHTLPPGHQESGRPCAREPTRAGQASRTSLLARRVCPTFTSNPRDPRLIDFRTFETSTWALQTAPALLSFGYQILACFLGALARELHNGLRMRIVSDSLNRNRACEAKAPRGPVFSIAAPFAKDMPTPTLCRSGMRRYQPFHALFVQRTHLLLALVSGLLLTACNRKPQAQVAPPPPEVCTVTVARGPVLLTTELPGRTAPYRIAEIRPQVNGLIQKRLFVEGSEVKAGQELYQIDPAPFQAALDNAQAALGRAQANLPAIQVRVDRYKAALADKAVSQQDFDDASAALKQALADIAYYQAMVATAKINLGYTRVVAPISGRIGKSSVTDGAIVTAYQPMALATIQQLDPIYVDVPQSTTVLLELQRRLKEEGLNHDGTNQNKVQLVLENGAAYPLEGTLQFQDISVDSTTGSVILRVVVPNPNGVLLPSMFVRAVIKEGVNEGAILIPQQAVGRTPKGKPVALIVGAEGKVEQRMLGLDRALGDQWLVSSGLAPGERVITEGLQRVRAGVVVKEVPAEASQKAAVKTAQAPASASSN
jgi:membrane fusion protein, multidrug efflux system